MARIEGVSEARAPWWVRMAYRFARRTLGKVPEPVTATRSSWSSRPRSPGRTTGHVAIMRWTSARRVSRKVLSACCPNAYVGP
jgi:hypothetical protein